jgi:hypothetical protein
LNDPCAVPCCGLSLRPEGSDRRASMMVVKCVNNGSLGDVLKSARVGSRPTFWKGTGIAIIVLGLAFIRSRAAQSSRCQTGNLLLDGEFHYRIGDSCSSNSLSVDVVHRARSPHIFMKCPNF